MSEEIAVAVQDAPVVQEPSAPVEEVKTETETKPEKSPEQIAFEKRIARQTAANRDTQRQLQEAKARIADYEAKLAAAKPDPLADKPIQDNFDSIEDYAEALADWKLNQKTKETEAKAKEPNVDEIVKQRLEVEKANLAFKIKEDAFRKAQPDYDKSTVVVNNLLKHVDPNNDSTKAFAATLLNAPNAPAVVHYLGTHPDEAINMMQMSPFEIQDRLGEIIDQLETPTTGEVNDDQPIIPTALPTPPSALNGKTRVNKTASEMSGKELLAKYMPTGR